MRLQRDGTFSIATSENFFGIYSVEGGLRHGKRAMPAPICTNIHRKNEVTNNRQLLLADGFSFYAVAEISTTPLQCYHTTSTQHRTGSGLILQCTASFAFLFCKLTSKCNGGWNTNKIWVYVVEPLRDRTLSGQQRGHNGQGQT